MGVPVYQAKDINFKTPNLTEAGIWGDIRFDPSDESPTYIGLNLSNPADTSETSWKVYKFAYDGTGSITRVQLNYGSWDGRAGLNW
jgi:hypothetical protein